jgi:hypothetical protein
MEVKLNLHVGLTVEATSKDAAKAVASSLAKKLDVGASSNEMLGDFAVTLDSVAVSEVKPRAAK